MALQLNRPAYQKVIDEDIAAVQDSNMSRLEARHTIEVLKCSVDVYYPPKPPIDYEELYHQLMSNIKRSKLKHGDCKSGKRYNGQPLACTACMANIKIEEAIQQYKGRTISVCNA